MAERKFQVGDLVVYVGKHRPYGEHGVIDSATSATRYRVAVGEDRRCYICSQDDLEPAFVVNTEYKFDYNL